MFPLCLILRQVASVMSIKWGGEKEYLYKSGPQVRGYRQPLVVNDYRLQVFNETRPPSVNWTLSS